MYETLRIVKKLKPKYVVWENVKNLIGKNHIHNFNMYLDGMEIQGYTNYYKVMNAKDYGIPQNRERIFIVSIRKDQTKIFKFPKEKELKLSWQDFISNEPKKCVNKTPSRDVMRKKCKNITNLPYCFTITLKQDRYPNAGIIDYDNYYRFLTPRECWRLMGFDDEDFNHAAKVCTNTQLYKQAGNSIVVDVLEAILKELLTLS